MSYILVLFLVLGAGSYLYNGGTPEQDDKHYIQKYRVLNATDMTDAEILEEREEDRKSAETWKVSNKLLADELAKRGIEHKIYKAQYHLDQLLFHNAYYDDNMTVEEFVNKQYKDK